ncbi:hypothetical protein FRC08_008667 [Ceratobasidium sp. 394]|nr:hypothetical protein FRC08_008667 [Ceratobasidium sp. 394]
MQLRPLATSSQSDNPKYIIALCDGTGKNGEKDEHQTNVYRLYSKILKAGHKQATVCGTRYELVPCYFPGIGCQSTAAPGYLAKIFGRNIVKLVGQVYMFIIEQYRPGDHVCIFGYSRGAFVARKVASLLHHLGRSVKHEVELMEQWKNRESGILWGSRVVPDPIPVKYLGVWDTVGGIYSLPRLAEVKGLMGVSDEELPVGVEHALHAVAFHENRKLFRVTLFDKNPKTDLQEVWFAGAHSDVGGGDKETELSKISLNWMIRKVDAFSHLEMTPLDYTATEKLVPHDAFHETSAAKRVLDREETRIQHGTLHRTSEVHQTVDHLQGLLADTTCLATLAKLRQTGWNELGFLVPCPTLRPKKICTTSFRSSTLILPTAVPSLSQPERRCTPHYMRTTRTHRDRSWLTLAVDQVDANEWQVVNH